MPPFQQDSSLVLRLQVTKDLLLYAMLRLQLDFETHAECYVYGAMHLICSVGWLKSSSDYQRLIELYTNLLDITASTLRAWAAHARTLD